MQRLLLLFITLTIFVGCATARQVEITAEVVTPAGSAIYFDSDSETPQNYSNENVILYLPFPANLGVISSEHDEHQLQVLILSPSFKNGTILDITPIGVFEIIERGKLQNLILAIPADPKLQVIKSPTLDQLRINYSGVIEILEIWIANHRGENSIEIKALHDEQKATKTINDFLK